VTESRFSIEISEINIQDTKVTKMNGRIKEKQDIYKGFEYLQKRDQKLREGGKKKIYARKRSV